MAIASTRQRPAIAATRAGGIHDIPVAVVGARIGDHRSSATLWTEVVGAHGVTSVARVLFAVHGRAGGHEHDAGAGSPDAACPARDPRRRHGCLVRRRGASCGRHAGAGRNRRRNVRGPALPRVHDLVRPGQADGRAVRVGRARVHQPEGRRHQGVRLGVGHDADDRRRPQRRRDELLGPGPAEHGPGPGLSHQAVPLRLLRVGRRDRREPAALGRLLPHDARRARLDDGRVRGQRTPGTPDRRPGDEPAPDAEAAPVGRLPAVPEPRGRRHGVRGGRASSTSPWATARTSTGWITASAAARSPTRPTPTSP